MPTTNERLTREISAQAEQFDEIFANDDPFDELWEAPLEVTTRTQLVVTLCTGGPHVKAGADLDNDGAIVSASIVGYWGERDRATTGGTRWLSPYTYRTT